jgi:hypothetical protein
LDIPGAVMGKYIDPHHILFLQGLYEEEDRVKFFASSGRRTLRGPPSADANLHWASKFARTNFDVRPTCQQNNSLSSLSGLSILP